MQPEVQSYLAERLETLRLLRQLGQEVANTVAHIGGALEAFRRLGAITDEEWRDWSDRATKAAGVTTVSLTGHSELHSGGGVRSEPVGSALPPARPRPAPWL